MGIRLSFLFVLREVMVFVCGIVGWYFLSKSFLILRICKKVDRVFVVN